MKTATILAKWKTTIYFNVGHKMKTTRRPIRSKLKNGCTNDTIVTTYA